MCKRILAIYAHNMIYNMIYTAPCIMFWTFLGPKWLPPIGSMLFHRAQKNLDLQGPTPFHLALVLDIYASKTLCTGAV
jgi:hypothetical protein